MQKKEKFSISEMFSCELKFVINILKKWLYEKYFRRSKGLDLFIKQKSKRERPIDWEERNRAICKFRLPTAASNFPNEKLSTSLDFVIAKEHAFIRNIFDYDELKQSKSIETHERYQERFRKMLQIVVLSNTTYLNESDIEDILDDCIAEFVNEMSFESFSDLFLEIENTEDKNIGWKNRKDIKLIKLITFVYCSIMNFPENKFEIKTVATKKILTSVKDVLFGSYVIHHSHVICGIVGYAHDFCNKKLKETQNLVPVFTLNLFSFDFFFVAKSIRLCVWLTKQLNIGGTNLTNIQYVNTGSQVKFIDTIKYYNQSLLPLAKSTDGNEKTNIRKSCQKFIETNPTYSAAFNFILDENKEWILDYLSGRKGVIPYEKIKSCEDLNCVPENQFFSKTEFYSLLKNEIISDEGYENIKKIWRILRLKKLSKLNDIYNFQDTIILCENFENRAEEMIKKFPYISSKMYFDKLAQWLHSPVFVKDNHFAPNT